MAGRADGQTTTTDSRSKRIRVSRRGGQVLTRARGPSNDYGLPDLRLLPDGPVPDGRTVLTNPDATGIEAVRGHRAHLAPFIPVTNPLERVNKEIGRRSDVVGIYPNDQALIRLAGMLLIEQNDEWLVQRRYLSDHSIQLVLSTPDGSEPARSNNNDKEVIELNAA